MDITNVDVEKAIAESPLFAVIHKSFIEGNKTWPSGYEAYIFALTELGEYLSATEKEEQKKECCDMIMMLELARFFLTGTHMTLPLTTNVMDVEWENLYDDDLVVIMLNTLDDTTRMEPKWNRNNPEKKADLENKFRWIDLVLGGQLHYFGMEYKDVVETLRLKHEEKMQKKLLTQPQ